MKWGEWRRRCDVTLGYFWPDSNKHFVASLVNPNRQHRCACALAPSAGQELNCWECVCMGQGRRAKPSQSALHNKITVTPRSVPYFLFSFLTQRSRNGWHYKAEWKKSFKGRIFKMKKCLLSLTSKLCEALSYPFSSFNPLCAGKTVVQAKGQQSGRQIRSWRSLECRKSKRLLHTHVHTHLFWYTNTWVHRFLKMLPSKALYVWHFTSEMCWMVVNKVNRAS